MAESKRFLHDVHTGRSFVTAARRNPDACKTRGGITSAPQSFTRALQALDASDPRPRPVFSIIDHRTNQINMSRAPSIHKILQVMFASKVNSIANAKIQTKHTPAAEEVFVDMLKAGYLAAVDGIKDTLYRLTETILKEMTLKGTLAGLLCKTLSVGGKPRSLWTPLLKRY